ncbi:hypothetical protein H5410_024703 [Solanum commersonii]|uniref:Uncharacterized protein n=1 Tax=Solanum commersonii TaxID=4109 RepID=A0A9J5ZMQ5_SOLCO|nr:hypothetical protein H5410_024703 [Solanum commersonii]
MYRIPSHLWYLFPIPLKVIEKLDMLRRNFLWQGGKEGKGYYLVKWNTVMQSKLRGGLGNPGIRNLKVQNRNLLMKWLWRFIIEDNTLWKEAETTKYGELNPRALWSFIEENLILKVGSANNFNFWSDGWIDQTPLSESFPDLFFICTNPDA